MNDRRKLLATGWLRDYPDIRDYTLKTNSVSTRMKQLGVKASISEMAKRIGLNKQPAKGLPVSVDLRPFCPPVEDQDDIGSCTAHAGVGLIEYYERRAFGKHIDASRLFLYKVTRNLLHWTGDTGAFLRTTMKAMAIFGVPPEEYWPYHTPDFDVEPPAFCYSFGQNYQAMQYFRLDGDVQGEELLDRIKLLLAFGLPSMFGFSVFSSIWETFDEGLIPFPGPAEQIIGGHAIVAVGYDNKKEITNPATSLKTKGALLIRNSWGLGFGGDGYGWLPYDYVKSGLAVDWWTLLKNEWVDLNIFTL